YRGEKGRPLMRVTFGWFAVSLAVLALAATASAGTGIYPRMSPATAKKLTTKMTTKWMSTQQLPAWWYSDATCLQVKPSEYECTQTVYRNARGTLTYAKLTIDVWNGQLAPNGNYFSHQAVVDSQRY